MPINADKPQLWKADVERSIDFYNDWFIRFAPETYRAQRRITTDAVLDAFGKTANLTRILPKVHFQERREPAPFLASYMGRANGNRESPIRFFVNFSSAIVTNVFLNLCPTSALAACLNGDRERIIEMGEALNNVPAECVLHAGRAYGGGLHKIEPKELLEVPLASAPGWLESALNRQLALI